VIRKPDNQSHTTTPVAATQTRPGVNARSVRGCNRNQPHVARLCGHDLRANGEGACPFQSVAYFAGVASCRANQASGSESGQVCSLRKTAVKISAAIGGENSSARWPSMLTRRKPPTRSAALRVSNMASARFTIGSPVDPILRSKYFSGSSARFIAAERRVA
jgi:hypothetical protein